MAADPLIPSPVADKLALAMVTVSTAPLLLLDGALNIVAASASFSSAFALDPAAMRGADFFGLGAGEWGIPQLRSLLKATLSGSADVAAYEIDLKRAGQPDRRLVLNAHRLDYDDPDNVRLLLTAVDVTEARIADKLKDTMLSEKAFLLQEVQHRVANSLQIIASVLLQSARRVQSAETRSHLQDAHHRVMSIATVQKQLAVSHLEDVDLRSYFTQLCESLGASMISDHDRQSIQVDVDGSRVTADVSVSLGLIVTELVINALKHAFPAGQAGQINVGYAGKGSNWTLSVSDNGVGMPEAHTRAKPGLGTSIIEALARQLNAKVNIANARPGTAVSIIHAPIPALEFVERTAI
jgi:two-component sensor histidine kinase